MEGVITVQDSRKNLVNMKAWRNEAVKTVQQENQNAATKNILNTVLDVTKIGTMAVGAVATVVAALSPAPVLSPVIAKASTALTGAVEGSKALLNGAPREQGIEQISAAMSDLKGSVKDISIRDKNIIKANQPEHIQSVRQTMQDGMLPSQMLK